MKYSRQIVADNEDSLSKIAALVAEDSTVLDLGVGAGRLGQFLASNKACLVDGIEKSVEHLQAATPHYRRLEEGDLENADAWAVFPSQTYDFVVMADVLEHVLDREGLIARACEKLNPDGKLLISVPNVAYAGVLMGLLEGQFNYTDEGILDETHVRFYTLQSIVKFLEAQSLRITSIDSVSKLLHETEFSRYAPELVPGSVRQFIVEREGALVYQYVLSARPGNSGEAGVSVDDQMAGEIVNRFESRIYWMSSSDLQHKEEKSRRVWNAITPSPVTISFDLSDSNGVEKLRYIPSDRQGILHIESLLVIDSLDGRTVNICEDYELTEMLCQDAIVSAMQDGPGYCLLCQRPYGWFELSLDQLFEGSLPTQVRIELRQSWQGSQDYLALLDSYEHVRTRTEEQTNLIVEQRAHLRGLAGEIAALKHQLSGREQPRLNLADAETTKDREKLANWIFELRQGVKRGYFYLRRSLLRRRNFIGENHFLELEAITNGSRLPDTGELALSGDCGHLFFPIVPSLRGDSVFFEVKYSSKSRLQGPKLYEVVEGVLHEVSAPIYEDRKGGVLFGTLKFPNDLQGLVLAPSRLDHVIEIESFRVKTISVPLELVSDYWHWYWFYRVFGRDWVLERFREEVKIFFEEFPRLGKRRKYADWWSRLGRVSSEDLIPQRTLQHGFEFRPKLSIIMPVYNTPAAILSEAVQSVLSQTYDNWELCIVDDCSSQSDTIRQLEAVESLDVRIIVYRRSENGHISAATNDGLKVASGQYVAFMDHDDTLTADALFSVVQVLQGDDPPRVIYSDEDIVDRTGVPIRPHFKPDWNPDYLLSINYICHLLVVERELVNRVGGLREGFEGAQDYDLILRLIGETPSEGIKHIPKVLYHWRAMEGSTAEDIGNKDYAVDAGLRALKEFVEKRSVPASVELSEMGMAYRLRYHLSSPPPSVEILMPTRDCVEILSHGVSKLLSLTDYGDYRLTIIDNESCDPACLEYLREIQHDPRVKVVPHSGSFNFSALINSAARESSADVLVMLNNDMEVINHDWLTEMVSHAMREEIGAVGAKLFYASDYIQHAGVILGVGPDRIAGHAFKGFYKHDTGHMGRLRLIQNYSAVTGACLAVRRELFWEVGGLDEENLAVAFNDVDFCLKLQSLGYRNLWTPYAQLYHFESYTRGYDVEGEKRDRFIIERDFMREKWGSVLDNDPSYNPNLTRDFENFDLEWSGRV